MVAGGATRSAAAALAAVAVHAVEDAATVGSDPHGGGADRALAGGGAGSAGERGGGADRSRAAGAGAAERDVAAVRAGETEIPIRPCQRIDVAVRSQVDRSGRRAGGAAGRVGAIATAAGDANALCVQAGDGVLGQREEGAAVAGR